VAGAAEALRALTTMAPIIGEDGRAFTLAVDDTPGMASRVVDALTAIGASVDEVAMHRPSLDDVFFHLTGHAAIEDDSKGEAA
jgi:ABC-2 type transport system ATP-binding protein